MTERSSVRLTINYNALLRHYVANYNIIKENGMIFTPKVSLQVLPTIILLELNYRDVISLNISENIPKFL